MSKSPEVDIVVREDETKILRWRTAREEGEIEMDRILGFRFETGAETDMAVYANLIFVKKVNENHVRRWKTYLYFWLLCVPIFIVCSSFIGPLTTLGVGALALIKRDMVAAALSIAQKHVQGWFQFTTTPSIRIIDAFALLSLHSFGCLFVYNLCGIQVLRLLLYGGYAALILRKRAVILPRITLLEGVEFPRMVYPVTVCYEGYDIQNFIEIRDIIREDHRSLIQVPLGNRYLEAVCSVLVPSELYNSLRARNLTLWFFNYVLTVLIFLQAFLSLSPPVFAVLTTILGSIRSDLGVNIIIRILGSLQTLAHLGFLDLVFEGINSFVQDVLQHLSILRWIVDLEMWSTYVGARLQTVMRMTSVVQPIVTSTVGVGRSAVGLIKPLFGVIMTILRSLNSIATNLVHLQNRHLRKDYLLAKILPYLPGALQPYAQRLLDKWRAEAAAEENGHLPLDEQGAQANGGGVGSGAGVAGVGAGAVGLGANLAPTSSLLTGSASTAVRRHNSDATTRGKMPEDDASSLHRLRMRRSNSLGAHSRWRKEVAPVAPAVAGAVNTADASVTSRLGMAAKLLGSLGLGGAQDGKKVEHADGAAKRGNEGAAASHRGGGDGGAHANAADNDGRSCGGRWDLRRVRSSSTLLDVPETEVVTGSSSAPGSAEKTGGHVLCRSCSGGIGGSDADHSGVRRESDEHAAGHSGQVSTRVRYNSGPSSMGESWEGEQHDWDGDGESEDDTAVAKRKEEPKSKKRLVKGKEMDSAPTAKHGNPVGGGRLVASTHDDGIPNITLTNADGGSPTTVSASSPLSRLSATAANTATTVTSAHVVNSAKDPSGGVTRVTHALLSAGYDEADAATASDYDDAVSEPGS